MMNAPASGATAAQAPTFFLMHTAPRVTALAAALGPRARALPMFTLDPAPYRADVIAAQARLDAVDLLVFASPGAIDAFFGAIAETSSDFSSVMAMVHGDQAPRRWPAAVAVIGPGSAEAFAQACPDGVPGALLVGADGNVAADARGLLARLRQAQSSAPMRWQRALVVRGREGRPDLAQGLAALGMDVATLIAYHRTPTPELILQTSGLVAHWQAGRKVVLVATMTAAIDRLVALARAQAPGLLDWLTAERALAIHPRIGTALSRAGWRDVGALPAGSDALRNAIESQP